MRRDEREALKSWLSITHFHKFSVANAGKRETQKKAGEKS